MKCKNDCGGTVWWSSGRSQWVHMGTGKALCAFPGLPTSTLTALPAGDVHPATAVMPTLPPPSGDPLTAPHPTGFIDTEVPGT